MFWWENPCEFQCSRFSKITAAMCAPNPSVKTECKIRKIKRLFPSLSELSLTSRGKNVTAKGARRLTSVLICLYAWGNDIMLRSYVYYDLGAQKEAKSANRKPHHQDCACALATSHGEQRSAVLQWAVVWTRALQAKNLQIKEPLANRLLVSHLVSRVTV